MIYLTSLTTKIDHIGLVETGRHWPSLPEDDRITQKLLIHFMSHQLYATTAYNTHHSLSGAHQNGGTSSLTTSNIIGKIVESGRENSGFGSWLYQRIRGRGEASIRIITFYIPVTPTAEVFPGSDYTQQLTHFYNLIQQKFPRTYSLLEISRGINIWMNKVNQIIIMEYINKYILSKKPENLPQN